MTRTQCPYGSKRTRSPSSKMTPVLKAELEMKLGASPVTNMKNSYIDVFKKFNVWDYTHVSMIWIMFLIN